MHTECTPSMVYTEHLNRGQPVRYYMNFLHFSVMIDVHSVHLMVSLYKPYWVNAGIIGLRLHVLIPTPDYVTCLFLSSSAPPPLSNRCKSSTLKPAWKAHVLSNDNWPWKRADLISGLLASIRISDLDQPKTDPKCKKTVYLRTLQVGSSVHCTQICVGAGGGVEHEAHVAFLGSERIHKFLIQGKNLKILTEVWKVCYVIISCHKREFHSHSHGTLYSLPPKEFLR